MDIRTPVSLSKIRLTGLVFLSLLTGFTLARLLPPPTPLPFTEVRRSDGYRFINPLLECESANFDQTRLGQLRTNISQLIDNKISTKDITLASVYYRDLNNGPWFGINETELFSPASLIKVPLLMAVLKKAESDPALLSRSIVYDSQQFPAEDQNFSPAQKLVHGQSYTISQLLDQMIIYSDNIAYNILTTLIPNQDLIKVYDDLDVDVSRSQVNPAGNIITVKDYASFYRVLFNSSYLSKTMSEKALELLSRTEFKKGLVAGLPQNVTTAHKFGERQYLETGEKQLHDCGVVYLPSKPYLLCIMTRGSDFTRLTAAVKDISRSFYDQLSSHP